MVSLATRLRKGGAPRCPYCHDHLGEEALSEVTCEECSTRHHTECIRELGHCATYGCSRSIPTPLEPLNESIRDQIRDRIQAAAGRYADGAAAMSSRPRSEVGRERRHDDFRFQIADKLARNPEGALACLILAPFLVAGILALLGQLLLQLG